MRAALSEFGKAVKRGDSARRLSATAEFYRFMQLGGGNSLIDALLQRLLARINFLRSQSMSRAGRAKHSFSEMRAIFQAIAKKDGRGAREAAELHVRNAEAAAKESFEAKEPTGGAGASAKLKTKPKSKAKQRRLA
jgi:DNA-binding GntR family transcriptional regulator